MKGRRIKQTDDEQRDWLCGLRYMSRQVFAFYKRASAQAGGRKGILQVYGVKSVVILRFVHDRKTMARLSSSVCWPLGLKYLPKEEMVVLVTQNLCLALWETMCDALPPISDNRLYCEWPLPQKEVPVFSFKTTREACSCCKEPAVAMCERCHKARYCGPKCQKSDWPEHSKTCRALTFSDSTEERRIGAMQSCKKKDHICVCMEDGELMHFS